MNKARLHRLFYWLLPLLVMRALIPVGFMLDTSQGHLSLMFCDGFGSVPAQVSGAHAHHEHHAHHETQSSGGDHASHGAANDGGSLCPFAVAAGAAPASHAIFSAETSFVLVAIAERNTAGIEIPFGPIRTQHSRGPPAFLI